MSFAAGGGVSLSLLALVAHRLKDYTCNMSNIKALDQLANQFEDSWTQGDQGAFKHWVNAVFDMHESGGVSAQDAARYIAGAMFVPGVDDDPLREEITILAGELEVQTRPVSKGWQQLRRLVDKL